MSDTYKNLASKQSDKTKIYNKFTATKNLVKKIVFVTVTDNMTMSSTTNTQTEVGIKSYGEVKDMYYNEVKYSTEVKKIIMYNEIISTSM